MRRTSTRCTLLQIFNSSKSDEMPICASTPMQHVSGADKWTGSTGMTVLFIVFKGKKEKREKKKTSGYAVPKCSTGVVDRHGQ